MTKLRLLAITALTVALTLTVSASGPKVKVHGTCKLIDIKNDKVLYHSDCKVVEKIEKSGEAFFKIKMDGRESLMFASYDNRTKWMHGPHQVHFKNKDNGGVFKWDGFKLKVTTD